MEKIDKEINWWVVKKEIEMYEKKLDALNDILTYGGYNITFAKSNRGTAHPNEVEIIANTAYPDMDIAQSIITQTIVIYEHKLRALRMSLMAIENTMK